MLSARLGFWWCFVRSWGWDDYFLIIVLPCRLIQVLEIQGEAVKNLNLTWLNYQVFIYIWRCKSSFHKLYWFYILNLTVLGRQMKLKPHQGYTSQEIQKSFDIWCIKGFLISKRFSLWLKSHNKSVPNQSPDH